MMTEEDRVLYESASGPIIEMTKFNPMQIDQLIEYVSRIRCKYATIITGSMLEEARDLGLSLMSLDPGCRVILDLPHNQMGWTSSYLSPNKWYETHARWLKEGFLVQISRGDSLKIHGDGYFNWMAHIIRRCGDEGYGVAAGGYDLEPDHVYGPEHEPMLEALHVYGDLSIWNPQEWFTLSGDPQKSRVWDGIVYASELGLTLGEVVINNYGLRINNDPDLGWKSVRGLSLTQYYNWYLRKQILKHTILGIHLQFPVFKNDPDDMFALGPEFRVHQVHDLEVNNNDFRLDPALKTSRRVHVPQLYDLPVKEVTVDLDESMNEEAIEDAEIIDLDLQPIINLVTNRKRIPKKIQIKLVYGDDQE